MSDRSKIEWTDSWNPFRARNRTTGKLGWWCVHAGEGRRNCYAERMNNDRLGTGVAYRAQDEAQVEVFLDERTLLQPLHWRKPRKIFVCSTTDLFGAWVKDEWLDRIYAVMALCPQHMFILLTKRPERMRKYCSGDVAVRLAKAIEDYGNSLGPHTEDFEFFIGIGWSPNTEPCKPDCHPPCALVWNRDRTATIRAQDHDGAAKPAGKCMGKVRWCGDPICWPLPNVWGGCSCSTQEEADKLIPEVLATPLAKRIVSLEPLLGPIDLTRIWARMPSGGQTLWNVLKGVDIDSVPDQPHLNWVIVGGASGPGARPMHLQWARDIRDQCKTAGVPFFFKQWGEHVSIEAYGFAFQRLGKRAAGRLLDGVEHNEFP